MSRDNQDLVEQSTKPVFPPDFASLREGQLNGVPPAAIGLTVREMMATVFMAAFLLQIRQPEDYLATAKSAIAAADALCKALVEEE